MSTPDQENTQPYFVHPSAICESDEVGAGTRIWAFAHVMPGAAIGCDCNIGDHAYIESGVRIGDRATIKNQVMCWEGVTIEDDVFVGPAVVFTNDAYPRSARMEHVEKRYCSKDNWLEETLVQCGASIGAGAIIRCGVTIGPYAMVGAGALVTRDVPAHSLVLGQPARRRGWVCVCGCLLDNLSSCPACGLQYRHNPGRLEVAETTVAASSR